AILQFVKGLIGVFENVIGFILSRIANALTAVADFFTAITNVTEDDITDFMGRVLRIMTEFSAKAAKGI
ncbi:hypothetical protein LCGC14_2967170, partial [marine sediment metagenome]